MARRSKFNPAGTERKGGGGGEKNFKYIKLFISSIDKFKEITSY